MRHYPATRHTAHLAGLEHAHAPARVSVKTVLLAIAAAFAAGFCAAVYSVGWIVSAP